MREAIRLPQFGMGMMDAEMVEWFKEPGDVVAEGEPICLIDAAKVETELEAPYSGVLAEIVVAAGMSADVGDVLGWIETTD